MHSTSQLYKNHDVIYRHQMYYVLVCQSLTAVSNYSFKVGKKILRKLRPYSKYDPLHCFLFVTKKEQPNEKRNRHFCHFVSNNFECIVIRWMKKKPTHNFHCSNFLDYFVTLMNFQNEKTESTFRAATKIWITIDSTETISIYLLFSLSHMELSVLFLIEDFPTSILNRQSLFRHSFLSLNLLKIVFYLNDKREMKRREKKTNTDRFQVNWTAMKKNNANIFEEKQNELRKQQQQGIKTDRLLAEFL